MPENRLESCKLLNWLTLSVIRVSVHVTVTSRMKSTQNFELFSANWTRFRSNECVCSNEPLKPSAGSGTRPTGNKRRVWGVTAGRIEGQMERRRRRLLESESLVHHRLLMDLSSVFVPPGSFISIGWSVLSDSGGGSLLLGGARASALVAFHLQPSNTNQ